MHFFKQNWRRIQRNSSGTMRREDTGEEVANEPAVDLTANLTEYFPPPASISIGTERFQKKQPHIMKEKEKVDFS